ncbi:MAG TPA: hypothetical protein VMZ29_10915 [Candidatus Bathyarchaeia archaeon]|nr:hypothetical protein [Candidatus Bathyarchaeia archaeon]
MVPKITTNELMIPRMILPRLFIGIHLQLNLNMFFLDSTLRQQDNDPAFDNIRDSDAFELLM